ncbi:GAF domain-containing protein [Leptothoe kymatousa]|uniref:GAF domain-containing protein n=1 Tax=Leptothoe kymatousa TAU-MAC 1615 TaxID=2364775 RepID=A0ABS5Y4W0_9CYAN|nr:GAF domain-containing protein [Leptothoe kymatousa]MBT9312010.1 GAF domain-containing protein [Leptothoe kymatousa TAU-MAC 1615]
MSIQFDPEIHMQRRNSEAGAMQSILQRLSDSMQRDQLVQKTTDTIRSSLQVDRVAIYYFYNQWEGQVTFESLSDNDFSIYGSTGPDQCFNDEYADLYLDGRIRAIEDVETASIEPCHRDFLRHLRVRANLVVPVLTDKGLWGLLVAHNCRSPKAWSEADIEQMRAGAVTLSSASSIRGD